MNVKERIIERYKTNIESTLDNWAFVPNSPERHDKLSEIKRWLRNFEYSEIEDAVQIMEKIQYYDDNRIRNIIKDLAYKIQSIFGDELNDVLFFPLGQSSASSGSMYLYQYRKDLGLSENNFKQDSFEKYLDKPLNIVFFDDIIGSGNQACRFFNRYLVNRTAKSYYFSLLGFYAGFESVSHAGFERTVIGEVLTEEDKAFSENSGIFQGEEKLRIKQMCEKYGVRLFGKHPLGYDNTQALIVFPHNTPNNTLPIIWASSDNEAWASDIVWHPLWNRKKAREKKRAPVRTSTRDLFQMAADELRLLMKDISWAQIREEENSESICYTIEINNKVLFLKISRNIYFDSDSSILLWIYVGNCPTTNTSFNGVIKQEAEDNIVLTNLGAFLRREESEIKYISMKEFMNEISAELNELKLK